MEEVVDRIVTELDFQMASDAEATVKKFEDMGKKVQSSNKNFSHIRAPRNSNKIDLEAFPYSYDREMSKLYRKMRPQNINALRKSLAIEGFRVSSMDDEEIFKTHMNYEREKKSEKESEKIVREERRKNAKVLKEERGRSIFMKKIWSSLGFVTKGLIGVSIAKQLGSAIFKKYKEVLGRGEMLQTQALLGNSTPAQTQALEKWFEERNIDPKKGFQTIESYRKVMNRYDLSDAEIIKRLSKEAKSTSGNIAVRSAQKHGGDPTTMRRLREEDISKIDSQLKELEGKSFSEDDYKKMERGRKAISRIGNVLNYENFLIKFVDILEGVATALEAIDLIFAKAYSIFEKVFPIYDAIIKASSGISSVIDKMFNNQLPDDLLKNESVKDTVKPMQERNVSVINNFNIRSSDPEKAASEVQKLLTSNMFSKINDVQPATVI
jgi:hypothetical protein